MVGNGAVRCREGGEGVGCGWKEGAIVGREGRGGELTDNNELNSYTCICMIGVAEFEIVFRQLSNSKTFCWIIWTDKSFQKKEENITLILGQNNLMPSSFRKKIFLVSGKAPIPPFFWSLKSLWFHSSALLAAREKLKCVFSFYNKNTHCQDAREKTLSRIILSVCRGGIYKR